MQYQKVNMENYPRRDHFAYFSSMAYPYVGMTVNVDITEVLRIIQRKKLPFFLTICYCVSEAANRIPEFRQRILNGKIVEYDHCMTSHTVALEDGTYCYCTLDSKKPYREYLPEAVDAQNAAKIQRSIQEDADTLGKFFISTVPWVSYTALVQPVPSPADSNPRITWGKYFTQEGRILLPLSVLCHHALVDGIHIAAFYRGLAEEIENFVRSEGDGAV